MTNKQQKISRNRAYGISYKYDFGEWHYKVCGPFATDEEAEEWLQTPEYDFRERELTSKTGVIKCIGKAAFRRYEDERRGLRRYGWY